MLVCHVLRKSRPETRIMQTLSIPVSSYTAHAQKTAVLPLWFLKRPERVYDPGSTASNSLQQGAWAAQDKKCAAARRTLSSNGALENGKVKILIVIALVSGKASAS